MVAVPAGGLGTLAESRQLALIGLALGFSAAVAVGLFAPSDGDPLVFLTNIVDPIARGAVAYRDHPVEYPPLALLPLVLPRIVVGLDASVEMYKLAFGVVALTTTLVCGAVVSWLASRGWSRQDALDSMLVFVAMAFALTVSVLWRFDILPAALTAIGLVAVAAGRPGWAGVALGFAVASKLYPAFLAPVFLGYYAFNGRWRAAGVFFIGLALSLGAVLAEAYLVAGSDSLQFLTYQRDRGTEIESVVGGLALAADAFAGIPARVSFEFGSFQVSSPVIRALAVPDFVAQVGLTITLVVSAVIAAWRDRREVGSVTADTLVTYIVATLLLVILANKVLSPQYLVWLLPFAALLPARQSFVLVIAGVLTTLIYPIAFDVLRAADPLAVATLNVRNLLLLVLFGWVLIDSHRRDIRQAAHHPYGHANREHHKGNALMP